MTTISDLCRDRRLLSWGINNLPLSLHKPVRNFRYETALPEHVRSASCLDQRSSAREPLAGEKRGNQVHILGMMMESQKKNGISLVNCLFGGWEAGKEKQSLFQASQDWLATHPGNMD